MTYKIKYSRKEKKEQKKIKPLNQNNDNCSDNWIDLTEESNNYIFI